MKVYVLMANDLDGSSIFGIYASMESAKRAQKVVEAHDDSHPTDPECLELSPPCYEVAEHEVIG